jgi:hypothetical protein
MRRWSANRNFAHFSPEVLHDVEEDFEWEHFSLFAFLVEAGLLPNVAMCHTTANLRNSLRQPV